MESKIETNLLAQIVIKGNLNSDVKHHKPNPLRKQLWHITNVISTRKEAMMIEIRNILFPFPILDNNTKFVSDVGGFLRFPLPIKLTTKI
jgi:hypothetical protein